MTIGVTISIPIFPKPRADDQYEQRRGRSTGPDRKPILSAESYDTIDGYGIAGGDMIPDSSWTFNAERDFTLRLRYIRGGKSEYPLLVYLHPEPGRKLHLRWLLKDGSERGAILEPGRTADLRYWWADAWTVEAKME